MDAYLEKEYNEYRKEFKFCQCILEYGKRKGQLPYEYEHYGENHKRSIIETIKRENISIKLIGKKSPCRALVKKRSWMWI